MPPDPKGSVAVKLSNLRKLNGNLEFYITQVMNLPIEDPVDVARIARNNDEQDIMKLLELVIGVAVQCSQREKVISRILQLPEACQAELMFAIKNVIERNRRLSISTDPSEYNKLKLLNQELTREVESLNQELIETRKEHELYRNRVEKMMDERPPDKATLQVELEGRLLKEMDLTQDLTRQLTDLKKKHSSEVGELRDELDIATERILQLSKLEPAIEKLKTKNEEANAIKKKLQEMTITCEALEGKLRMYEEQQSTGVQVHETLAIFKEQFTQEKNRNVALSLRIEALESEIRDTNKQKAEALERCKLLEAKAQQLSTQITSLVHIEPHEGTPFSADLALTEQTSSGRVQQTVEELQKHFNEQLENLLREKLLLEEKLRVAVEEAEELRQHPVVMRVDDQQTKALLRVREEEVAALTEQKADLLQRLELLAAELKKGESALSENDRLRQEKDGLMAEMARVYREKDDIGQKIFELKDSDLKHLTELKEQEKVISQLREENLRLKELNRELKLSHSADTIAVPAPAESPEQVKNFSETLRIMSENHDLTLKLRDQQDAYKSLSRDFDQLKTDLETTRQNCEELLIAKSRLQELQKSQKNMEAQHKQRLSEIEAEIGTKGKRLEDAESREKEMRKLMGDEEKLMAIALHELGMELFRQVGEKNAQRSRLG